MTESLVVRIVGSKAWPQTFGGRIEAGVTLHLMGKIRMQEGKATEALVHVQEAVTIFRETGSRHLPEAEGTLQAIQERMQRWENE